MSSVVVDGVEYTPRTYAQMMDDEIAYLREALKVEKETHFSQEESALTTMQNAMAEIDRLNALIDKRDAKIDRLKQAQLDTIEAWTWGRNYWRDFAGKNATAVAVYENAIDCLTAELEHPTPYAIALDGEIATANDAIKLLGEGFAREISAANWYAWGLVEVDEYVGRNFFRADCPIRGIVNSARKAGDAARLEPKA